MFSLYQKYWRTVFDIAVIALTVWLVMFLFSYLYSIATPVFLSFVIFWCIEPLAKWMQKLGIRKSIGAGISVLLFTIIVLALFAGIGFMFTIQISQLSAKLPEYQDKFVTQFNAIVAEIRNRSEGLPSGFDERLQDAIGNIASVGTTWAQKFLTWLVGFLTSFSSFVLNLSFAIVLAYFLSVEIDTWKRLGNERAPKTLKIALSFLRNNVFRGIGAYLKSQLILISITFAVIFLSLLALGVNNAFAIALLAGIFDVLPLLGVNTLFIPWIIYLFIVGDNSLAIWLTILLIVVMTTRQILEPRITGQTIGVSAFTMLAFMMLSLSLFGVSGLILAPILMILLKALYDQGYFHRWIRFPREEFNVAPLKPAQAAPDPENPIEEATT